MEIVRIYNNNVAVVKDSDGNESIVVGKGLAFQKRPGDSVDCEKIEKNFVMQSAGAMSRLEALVKDIPESYLMISEEIVRMIHESSDLELSENIYITLTDHISVSLKREQQGIVMKSPFLLEIKQFYKQEFALAVKAAEIIKNRLGIEISQDETATIALHIVNAAIGQSLHITMKSTKMIQDILNIVQRECGTEINTETLRYDRFVRHLQFLSRRLLQQSPHGGSDPIELFVNLLKYPQASTCVREIEKMLDEEYGVQITSSEKNYLVYHIINVTNER